MVCNISTLLLGAAPVFVQRLARMLEHLNTWNTFLYPNEAWIGSINFWLQQTAWVT